MYDFEEYYQAQSVADALHQLEQFDNALLICGGTDVLIDLRAGKYDCPKLISIHGLKELQGVRLLEEGTIEIGPATTFAAIEEHPELQKLVPFLCEAAGSVGGPQIRQVATIGGNLCNGAVSADSAPVLLALEAVLELTSLKGKREVPLGEFYTGPGKTVREKNEILTAIRIPKESYEGTHGHFIKYGKRNAMEISTLNCGVNIRLDDGGSVEKLRIAFGVSAPTPIRLRKAEELAKGRKIDDSFIQELQEAALMEVNPRSSWRASKEFRLQVIKELVKRAVMAAAEKGGAVHA